MAEAESSDEEWDTVERPAFYSGSPHEKETRREPTPEPYGELTVASVFDYTIERQGLRLCVTFAIQVVTAEGDAPQGESPNDFDAGCSRSPPFPNRGSAGFPPRKRLLNSRHPWQGLLVD